MSKIVTISSDPYSRVDTVRRPHFGKETCAWCGSRPARFNYGFQAHSLSGATSFDGKSFCSIGCRRSYYGD